MTEPSLDELLSKVDSKYSLVVMAAKRAREMMADGDEGAMGQPKPVSRALEEIADGTIRMLRVR